MAPVLREKSQEQTDQSLENLKRFYHFIEIVGMAAPFIFALWIIAVKSYFPWLGDRLFEVAGSLFVIGGIYLTLLILHRVFKKEFFLSVARYCYATFFVYFISITGGVESSFIFVLLFPIISSAVYFNRIETRNMGFFVTVLFAGSVYIYPHGGLELTSIIKHSIHVILIGIMSYLVYSVIIETLRQRTEKEETDKRLDEMTQVDRLKNDFLSVAQHQLRTPLSGVKWALEMLQAEPTMPKDSLPLIESSLERVKDSIGIINQMLKTVESEGRDVMISPEQTDLVGMVRAIVAELNFMTLKKGIKLTFICPDSLLIKADRDKMKAALINIIDNAIKYSPKGRVDVTITDTPGEALVTVKDTGIGISPEDVPFIFQRLHRGKNAVMMEPDESGVGLYTAKKIIELHGGAISVSSVLDKGTTVMVRLPKS